MKDWSKIKSSKGQDLFAFAMYGCASQTIKNLDDLILAKADEYSPECKPIIDLVRMQVEIYRKLENETFDNAVKKYEDNHD